ncbi:MAG: hypothetical protein AMXMBFR64_41670 [Myxococcales bacterium]
MTVLAALLGALAAVAWTVAAWSAVQMVRLRAPGVTLGYLATHGVAFFDATRFRPEAAPWRRRFVAAFAAFFACVLMAAAVAAAGVR